MDEKELAIVVKRINTMPRKMLNFLTPYEVFFNNSIALQN
jgi:IS30 family transposase